MVHQREVISTGSMRSSNDNRLEEPRLSRLMCVKRSFEYSAPREYNALPGSLRECEDLSEFKRKLKTFLFTDAYDLDRMQLNDRYAM